MEKGSKYENGRVVSPENIPIYLYEPSKLELFSCRLVKFPQISIAL